MSHPRIAPLRSVRSAILSLCGVLAATSAPAGALAAPFAYVPTNGSHSVTVIDTATDAVVDTIPVGVNPQHVAVHPVAPRVYVTHQTSLSVIDGERRATIGTVEFSAPVSAVAVHPAGTEVYVALSSGAVAVVDAATLVTTATIEVGGVPAGLDVHPSSGMLYVANGNLVVVDMARRTVATTVTLGPTPVRWLAVHPDGTRLYALDEQSNRVLAINTATYAVAGVVFIPSPAGAALDPVGSRLYVTSSSHHSLSVIETSTLSVVATVPLGAGAQPMGVAVHPSGQRVYVANSLFDTVAVIDGITHAVVRSIAVGRYPVALGRFIAPAASADEEDADCAQAEARILDLETALAGARGTVVALEAEVTALRSRATEAEQQNTELRETLMRSEAVADSQRATIRSLVLRVFGRPVDVNAASAARDIAEAQVGEAASRVGGAHRRVVQAMRHLDVGRAAVMRGDYRGAIRAFDQAFDTAWALVNPRGRR